ncbi:MAG: ATP-binding protein [Actinomycetes bacterium]
MAGIHGRGQGLRNLRERAEGLGGRAEIDSSPGQGTRVRVTIPR